MSHDGVGSVCKACPFAKPVVACLLLAWFSVAVGQETGGQQSNIESPGRVDCFGDPLPARALARLGTVRFRDGAGLGRLIFSPDGRTLVGGGYKGIHFWDTASGKQVRTLSAHSAMVYGVAYSPDGNTLASASDDKAVRLWDVNTGGELLRLEGHKEGIYVVRFSPDGQLLASGGYDGTVRLWDIAQGREVFQASPHRLVHDIAFSPSGEWMATIGVTEPHVIVWDVAARKECRRLPTRGHIRTIAFSPDGKQLAWGTQDAKAGGALVVSDVATGKEIRRLPVRFHCESVVYSPDGSVLAAAVIAPNASAVTLRDAKTGEKIREIPCPDGIASIAFAADSKTLAISNHCTFQLWDVATGIPLHPMTGHTQAVTTAAFIEDGGAILTGSADGTVRRWDVASGRETSLLMGRDATSTPLVLSPDGKTMTMINANDRTVALHSTATKQNVWTARNLPWPHGSLAYSPDGRLVAVKLSDQTIRVLDAFTGKLVHRLASPQGYACAIAFSPDGKRLASSDIDSPLCLWDMASGMELRREQQGADSIAFSGDGKLMACGREHGNVTIIDTASGRMVRPCIGDSELAPWAVAFSPDSRIVASGSAGGSIRLWEVASGKLIRRFEDGTGYRTLVLRFSPDGRKLLSAGCDSTCLIWDVTGLAAKPVRRELSAAGLEECWRDLGAEDAGQAYDAIWTLVATPGEAAKFLRTRLHPARRIAPERMMALILDLDSDQFSNRERAAVELEKLGDAADVGLTEVLKKGTSSADCRRRIEGIRDKLRRTPNADDIRQSRALAVLEIIGTPQAQEVLTTLAKGDMAVRLTAEAQSVLKRLGGK